MFCEVCWHSWQCQLPDSCRISYQFWRGFIQFPPSSLFYGGNSELFQHKTLSKGVSFFKAGVGGGNAGFGTDPAFFDCAHSVFWGPLWFGNSVLSITQWGIPGASLWKRSKSYGNVQNWVRKSNLSMSVSSDQKWQSEGHKVSFPGRAGDMPGTCIDELHTLWCPRQCSGPSCTRRNHRGVRPLWLFIRGLPFLMKDISGALILLLCWGMNFCYSKPEKTELPLQVVPTSGKCNAGRCHCCYCCHHI